MSETYRKKIDKLKDSGKLTDYEAEQSLRLDSIENILRSVESSLNSINSLLVGIYQKIEAKQPRY